MSQFIVSARKYRPVRFSDVIGQEHITNTLQNAVKADKIAQSMLFCGPRGVGKTTCARILAKLLNCTQCTEDQEPCNACASCISTATHGAMNIYELDAASNNSVEDIRSLVEQVRYPPQTGIRKVYIIDEVHMLSNSAFNAFLKTLEEPPSYVVFILATTEKQKIIPTILSRCQIFDFRQIRLKDMVAQLQRVAEQEDIKYELDALHIICQQSDGAMRDALSMFDLLSTASADRKVTYSAALHHLHVLDESYYFKLTDAWLDGFPTKALLIYDELLHLGFEGQHFLSGLGRYLRNLLVARDQSVISLLEVSESVHKSYQDYAQRIPVTWLNDTLQAVGQCSLQYKSSEHKRLHVELLLVACTQQQPTTAHNTIAAAPVALSSSPKLTDLSEFKKKLRENITHISTDSKVVIHSPVTENVLKQAWNQYAMKLQQAGRMVEYDILQQPIQLINEERIQVTLASVVQQDLLDQFKDELMSYLRTELQSPYIQLYTVVVVPDKLSKPYTAREKFGYLSEHHNLLEHMKVQLDLVLED